MGIVESCALVLVIAFSVIIVAMAIIQKIFDENRKNSERAMKGIESIMNTFVSTVTKTYDELMKKEEEQRDRAYVRLKKTEEE